MKQLKYRRSFVRGFHDLLSGKISVPAPFDKCTVVGPILNEGGLDELRKKLREELRKFFNKKPEPLNVDSDKVDRYLLNRLVIDVQKQTRLPGAPDSNSAIHIGWLGGKSPASWMNIAEKNWPKKVLKSMMFRFVHTQCRHGPFWEPFL